MNTKLSKSELVRYSRHLSLTDFGKKGQIKLKNSSVLVIGAGGLGVPLLQYLAAAGIGKIGIIDYDCVEISNLQRQVLYETKDQGISKAKLAAQKIQNLNPEINIAYYPILLDSNNILALFKNYDIIADGSDNFPTRYLVNDACVLLEKPLIYGSVFRYEGQVSVFNYKNKDGKFGPNYRDLFPEPPPPNVVPNCAEGGVLGVLPGIIGNLQAAEVIKVATGIGTTLSGQLLIYDFLSNNFYRFKIRKNKELKIEKLIDYDHFCSPTNDMEKEVKSISPTELKQLLTENPQTILIDVREAFEQDIANIGGQLIPLGDILNRKNEILKHPKVIFYCRSGRRSAEAIRLLNVNENDFDYINLEGGILAWADEVDPSMTKY
jgi:molybdopterin/thiamine biosynthesis adenylyltransferase/rhodanese-related sulfurtransferase